MSCKKTDPDQLDRLAAYSSLLSLASSFLSFIIAIEVLRSPQEDEGIVVVGQSQGKDEEIIAVTEKGSKDEEIRAMKQKIDDLEAEIDYIKKYIKKGSL